MFQSSWGNNNSTQQQPQQGTSAFGQPSTFGSAGSFGQNNQQQPAANPMFGNLAVPSTSTNTTTGFGAFSNANSNTPASGSLFGGAPKPATGFGAFGGGGTSTFGGGGGSAFGSTTNNAGTSTGGGLFGTNNTSNSAFGNSTTGGIFGSKPATTGFGSTTNNNGTYDSVAPVTTGTSGNAFSAFSEKDSANTNITLQYQSITAMPAYRGSSYEELRAQDYQQGRKTAGAFGQSSFGGAAQPSTTNAFGQPAQPAATNSIFGGASAFGANNNQTPSATGAFGTFGQTPAATGTSTFGGGSVFGQNSQQQQPSTGFGTFGQTQPAATTNAFGGGGVFGQNNNQSKPAGAFGSLGNISTTGGFGSGSTFGGGSAFGNNTQQQQPAAGGIFGQTQPQQNTGAFGAFGNTNSNSNAPKTGIFGQPATTQPAGSLFGQQNQTQQPAGGGLFGGSSIFGQNNNQQQQQPNQPATTSIFGSQPAAQPATGGSIFGGGGGLFGNNNQQQPPQNNSFGIFGQKPATTTPATGSLFGSSTLGQTNTTGQQSGSLFGSTNTQTGTAGSSFGGGGLFGNKPAAAPALGQSQSLFGNSGTLTTTTPGQPLTASIAQPIGANLPIFSLLPPGPRAVPLEQPKKKPGFFVDVPTRSPVPRLQLGYTPANTKLRGFGPDSSSSLAFSTGRPNALSLSRVDNNTPAGADGFLRNSSPALGSGGHGSVKKLILDKKVEPSDFFSKTASLGSRSSPSKVTFNPAMSQAARERDIARETASASPLNRISSPTPFIRPPNPPNHFSANSMNHVTEPKANGAATPAADDNSPQEGDYWVKPDLDALRRTGYQELSSFSGLVVGRIGYGEIHFLEPVDLTGLSKLDELQGLVVRFDDKECTVYPDSDDADKPAPGTGLNVKARITLIRCWAVDKATREPIKDEKHPSAVKHLKRLKNMRDTQFESFDVSEGKWTFAVDHF